MYTRTLRILCAGPILSVLIVPILALAEQADSAPTPAMSRVVAMGFECRVVTLKHVDCEQATLHVRTLFVQEGKTRKMTWYAPTNSVLIRAPAGEVEQMVFLLSKIDVPGAEPEKTSDLSEKDAKPPEKRMKIITVRHAKADQIVKVVSSMLWEHKHRTDESAKFAVDERTNVIVIRGTEEQLEKASRLVSELDVPLEHPGPPGGG